MAAPFKEAIPRSSSVAPYALALSLASPAPAPVAKAPPAITPPIGPRNEPATPAAPMPNIEPIPAPSL